MRLIQHSVAFVQQSLVLIIFEMQLKYAGLIMDKTKNPVRSFEITHTDIILDSITEGVFTVDENMIITYFNHAAEKITGVSKESAVGQHCYDVLKSNICEKTCPLQCSFTKNEEIINKHKNILRNDGTLVPVSISTSALRNEAGEIIGGVETFRDLSTIEE